MRCQRGHPFDEANTHLYRDRTGRVRRVCRACAKQRNPFRERLYGVSRAEYSEMVAKQNGVCALCGSPSPDRALAVDHDHASGGIRGLLCNPCNSGVGMFRDDPELLGRAIAYLERHRRGKDIAPLEPPVLATEDREKVQTAFDMLVDAFEADVHALAAGRPFDGTLMRTYLPAAGGHDVAFAIRFLVATTLVRERFRLGVPFPATCVAEEIALHAVMRTAIGLAAEDGDTAAADRLDQITESLLPDLDFLLLFEESAQLSREQAALLGVTHLWPEDWFRPFDTAAPSMRSSLN